jgi:HD-GYP domain-containing protein (c-di-GMP phosphodiesterase class II)
MDLLIRVLAQALDMVEIAYLGTTTNHGRRIAALCAAMGRELGLGEGELSDLSSCALLHDNALTEYILLKQGGEERARNLGLHCELGQRNVESLPFQGNAAGFILYHHERADGLGPFGKREGEFPLGAELIAAADMIDSGKRLQWIGLGGLPALREEIAREIGARFTRRAGEALLRVLDGETLASLEDGRIEGTTGASIPPWHLEAEDPALIRFAELSGWIIDCRSAFTRKHSAQIANRAWVMGEFYGYPLGDRVRLFLAAALHDLGKLAVPTEVLEKPGKLNPEEFEIIKTHIAHTRRMLSGLSGLPGLGDLVEWAANHHEKLNGGGYPLGKTREELDFNSRLMACVDVYQAVSEERPYHPRRSHGETMPVLFNMAEKGGLDRKIVEDMDRVMAPYSGQDLEAPRGGARGAFH